MHSMIMADLVPGREKDKRPKGPYFPVTLQYCRGENKQEKQMKKNAVLK